MKITLVAFAMLRDKLPESTFEIEVPDQITADQLMAHLAQEFPQATEVLKITRLAHQDDYVSKTSSLKPNAEYCLIPPVSGG